MAENKRYFINDRIRSNQLRVVNSKGENLGVISKEEALRLARAEGHDLVEIAPMANPPVAKILDYKKFLYEEKKKAQAIKAHSKPIGLKEFKFGPNIGVGDLDTRIRRAGNFLKKNDRVKFTVVFKGRENAYPEVGWEKINRAMAELKEVGTVEEPPKLVNKSISVMLLPK